MTTAIRPVGLSVVIPAYNEEKNLPETIREVTGRLRTQGWEFEIVVVDDGSTDGTVRTVESLALNDERVVLCRNGENLGMARAFLRGVDSARGEWVMLIPADLAIDANEIGGFLEATGAADIVLGVRANRDDYSVLRRVVSRVNIFLIQKLFQMPQRQFNFVAVYRRAIFGRIKVASASHFFHAEILIRARDAGFTIVEREADNVPRRFGGTSSGSPRVIAKAMKDLLAFWWCWHQDRRMATR